MHDFSTVEFRLTNSRLFVGEACFSLADERILLHGGQTCPRAVSCYIEASGVSDFIEAWLLNREMFSSDVSRGRVGAAGSRTISRAVKYRSRGDEMSARSPIRAMSSDYTEFDPELVLDDPERLIERVRDPGIIIERPERIVPEREIQRRIQPSVPERKPESSIAAQEQAQALPALDPVLLAKILISGSAGDGQRRLLLLPAVRGCVGRPAQGQELATTELLFDVSRPFRDLPPLRILEEAA